MPMPSPESSYVTAACERVNERVCAGLVACGCRLDVRGYSEADGDRYSDERSCVINREPACVQALVRRVLPDLEAGRAKADERALAACADAIDALAKECVLASPGPLPAACDALFIDVAKVGEPCRIEGGGIVFCGDGQGICTGAAPRTCEPLPGSGSPCASGRCGAGLVCVSDVCAAPGATGTACSSNAGCGAALACVSERCAAPVQAGGGCARSDECAAGLRCDGAKCVDATALGEECSFADACGAGRGCALAPETRTCRDPAKVGELCATDDCEIGLACDPATGTCARPAEEGRDCAQTRACAEGYACSDADQTCRRLPDVGETCFMGDRFCRSGLGCRESSNTCEEGGGAGSACLLNPPDYVCAPGFGCDFTANGSLCKELGGAGTACETSRTCSSTTWCVEGKCAPRIAHQQPCPEGAGCLPGLACVRQSGERRCLGIPRSGEPCESECAAGLRCRGGGGRCAPRFCLVP